MTDAPRDGRDIFYRGGDGIRASGLWALSVTTRQERRIGDLSSRRGHIGSQPLGTDGKYIYFTWREDLGDIPIMDVREDRGLHCITRA